MPAKGSKAKKVGKSKGGKGAETYEHKEEKLLLRPDIGLQPQFTAKKPPATLILETKGYDPLVSLKYSAAQRWVSAMNAEGSCGRWAYRMVKSPVDVPEAVRSAAQELCGA